jgi:hypothetical protein
MSDTPDERTVSIVAICLFSFPFAVEAPVLITEGD